MKTLARITGGLLLLASVAFAQNFPGAQGNPSVLSRPGGGFYAPAFLSTGLRVLNGNSTTGASTITIVGSTGGAGGLQLPDGTTLQLQTVFNTLTPIIVDWGQGAAEYVTPTAVSVGTCTAGNLGVGGSVQCAIFTGTFSNTHGQDAVVIEGTYGLQTAINYAQQLGGGIVSIDSAWAQMAQGVSAVLNGPASANALITGAIPYSNVSVQDLRGPNYGFWNVAQTASTVLIAPTTLTASTVGFGLNGANTTGGTYTGATTYFACIAYVDVAGQVGQCSASFSALTAGTGTTNQIGFAAPAAATGAVGYVVYIGATYSLAYEIPVTTTSCPGGLTTLETITPACKVTNATYNQTGSNFIASALPVNTSPVDMQAGGVSGTLLTGNPNGRQSYGYVHSNHLTMGMPAVNLAFTIGGIGSATPIAIGTVNVPSAIINSVGSRIRVCGRYQNLDVNSIKQNINIYWDAPGSNVAGSPVQIGALQAGAGPGTAAAYTGVFCEEFTTTAAGTGTAGALTPGFNFLNYFLTGTPAVNMLGGDTNSAAVTTIQLAGSPGYENRISVVHTNATGNATPQLFSLTIEVL